MIGCPHCGAEVAAEDEECWNCGGNVVAGTGGGAHRSDSRPDRRSRGSSPPGNNSLPPRHGESHPPADTEQPTDGETPHYTERDPTPTERRDPTAPAHRQANSNSADTPQTDNGHQQPAGSTRDSGRDPPRWRQPDKHSPASQDPAQEPPQSSPEGGQSDASPEADHRQPSPGGAGRPSPGGGTPSKRRHGPSQYSGSHSSSTNETAQQPPGTGGRQSPPGHGTPHSTPDGPGQSDSRQPPLSRRQLLAGGGALAAVAVGGWFLFLRGAGIGPGDSFGSATVLREGQYGPFEITDGERHYFGVDLREGEQLTATLSFEHSAGDLDMAVHRPAATDGDGGSELNSATSTDDNEQLRITARETGTYYLVPYGYRDNGNEYELTIEITDTDEVTAPSSPGESVADAPLVPTGTHGPYQITATEEHYFGVDLQANERLRVTISFDHDQADLDLAVQGPDGTEVASATSTTDDETADLTASTGGTYIVQVYPYGEGQTDYELSVLVS